MAKLINSQEIRVLHIGEIAGVPQSLRDGLRQKGYKSEVIRFSKHPFDFGSDFYSDPRGSVVKRVLKRIYKMYRLHSKYTILHFHISSVLPYGLDLPLWKALGKKVIFHYHGSDIRHKKQPLFHKLFVDRFIVSTPDLLEFVPKAIWLPNPINSSVFVPVDNKFDKSPIRILHAPSSREIKGTQQLIEAIKKIENAGYNITFILVENIKHNNLIDIISSSDIVVDWINPKFGIYGVFSIEAMSMGKPVMCCIRKDLLDKYNGLPIINTSPESLADDLQHLIEDAAYRNTAGKKSRKYVEQVHDVAIIVDKLIQVYKS